MNFPWKHCLTPVNPPQHGSAPKAFLDILVECSRVLPRDVYAINAEPGDIYTLVRPQLGPYTGILHRAGVMLEVLRVVAGFESDWDWSEGVDITNSRSVADKRGEETGAWQVSWDSLSFGDDLKECARRYTGSLNVDPFIAQMKTDRMFAVEYVTRLLRHKTRWAGTLNRFEQTRAWLSRESVAEFMQALAS